MIEAEEIDIIHHLYKAAKKAELCYGLMLAKHLECVRPSESWNEARSQFTTKLPEAAAIIRGAAKSLEAELKKREKEADNHA